MKVKNILIAAATAVILGVTCFGLYYVLSSNASKNTVQPPRETAAAFITAITSGEVASAYEYGTSFYKSKNTPQTIETFSDSVRSDNIKISNEELYMGVNDASNQAIYLAFIENLPPSSIGSTTGTFVVRLAKEDGKWKVDSMEVK